MYESRSLWLLSVVAVWAAFIVAPTLPNEGVTLRISRVRLAGTDPASSPAENVVAPGRIRTSVLLPWNARQSQRA